MTLARATYTAATSARVLRIDDLQAASDQFFGMVLVTPQLRCLLGLRGPGDPEDNKRFVLNAVARFLDGCRTARNIGNGHAAA